MEYQEIIAAIRNSRDLGLSDEVIRRNLLNSKFDEEEINKAFIFLPRDDDVEEMPESPLQEASPQPQQAIPHPDTPELPVPTLSTSLDWANLIQIFLFLSMYMLSASVAGILFFDIDKWFPSDSYPYFSALKTSINYWQVLLLRIDAAILLVSLAVFSYTLLWNTAHQQIIKLIRSTMPTKFFLYLTCVVYGLIIMANLIFVLFNLFNQTMSINVLGHVCVSVVISATILWYSLQQIS